MTATASPPELHPDVVGRDDELVALRRRLGEASLGHGSLTFVVAEAGLGKTRLVEEIAAVATSRRIRGVHGHGASGGERIACDLFSGVLAGIAGGGQRQAVLELVSETLPHLWSRILAGEAEPAPGGPDLAPELRHRLFVSRLVSLLTERDADDALLVCLEDLHAADSASLEVLHALSEELAQAPVMVVATLRPTADDGDDHLQRHVQELHGQAHVYRLDLSPLDEEQTRALVTSCFDREGFADEFLDIVHRRSGGVPLHVLQLLSLFVERGIVRQEYGLWINRRFDESEVPASARDAVRERLEALSESDRDLLGLAAIQGSRFEGVLLAQSLAQSPTRTLKQLAEIARRSRLIQATESGFRFTHPVIAELLYQTRSESQRRHVHLRLAYILERDYPRQPERLAHHLFEAGLHERALPVLLASTRRSIDTFAYRESRTLLTKAEISCRALGDGAPAAERREMLLLQAEVEDRLGDRARSMEVARTALSSAGDDLVVAGRALLQMAQVQRRLSQWDEARSLYDQALDHFVRGGDEARAAKAQNGLGNLAFERSDLEQAELRFSDARDTALRLDDPGLLGVACGNLGILATVRGDSTQAILHFTEAIKNYGRVNHHFGICQTYHNLGMCYAQQGEWQEALTAYGRGETLAGKLGTLEVLANLQVSKALALARLGRLDDAEAMEILANQLMDRLGDRLGRAECQRVEGILMAARGHAQPARERLVLARDTCRDLDNLLSAAECEQELGDIDRDAGEPESATSHYNAAVELFDKVGAVVEAQRCRERLTGLRS